MSAVLTPARQGFTQKGTAALLSSVLAENDLLIEQLTAYEAFSEPFVVQLAMKSGRVDISPHQMVGSSATVRLTRPSGLARFFNASRFRRGRAWAVDQRVGGANWRRMLAIMSICS